MRQRALLVDGAGRCDTAAQKNKKGKTAADIAFARGTTALGNRLRALELVQQHRKMLRDATFVRRNSIGDLSCEFAHDKVS